MEWTHSIQWLNESSQCSFWVRFNQASNFESHAPRQIVLWPHFEDFVSRTSPFLQHICWLVVQNDQKVYHPCVKDLLRLVWNEFFTISTSNVWTLQSVEWIVYISLRTSTSCLPLNWEDWRLRILKLPLMHFGLMQYDLLHWSREDVKASS